MKVRAIKLGYYDLKRKKVGEVFEMAEQDYAPKKEDGSPVVYDNGKPVTCSWVEVLDEVQSVPNKKHRQKSIEKFSSADSEVI